MIKIFTPGKTIYLTDNQTVYEKGIIKAGVNSAVEMKKIYPGLSNRPDSVEIYLYNSNIQRLLEYFSSQFHIIEAAGGLVKNTKGEWLFIFRNEKWDLPKGKIEKGEAVKEAAIREVEEECGINGLKITKPLEPTYHTYSINEKNILKRTYWFEMETGYSGKLIPQTEEGITDVRWVAASDIKPLLENTFDSIKEVLNEVIR